MKITLKIEDIEIVVDNANNNDRSSLIWKDQMENVKEMIITMTDQVIRMLTTQNDRHRDIVNVQNKPITHNTVNDVFSVLNKRRLND